MSIDWRIEGMAVGVFGFGAREMSENAPESFDVTWRNGAYYVSVPNYQGGTVYSAEYVERLRSQLVRARAALEPFAEIANELQPQLPDGHKNNMAWAVATVGEYRAALAALSDDFQN